MRTLTQKVRSLVRAGTYSAVSVLTLALGIGATVAVFGVVDAVLIRPLPFEAPEELIQVTQEMGGEEGRGLAPIDALLLEERISSFSRVAWFREPASMTLNDEGVPEVVRGRAVSSDFFDVLGRTAGSGRTFAPDESTAGSDAVAVLMHGFWQRRFGADPAVLGTTLVLDDRARTVIGVLPVDFRFDVDGGQDLFVPRVFDPESGNYTGWFSESIIGRLAPGASIQSTREELTAWAAVLETEFPTRRTEVTVSARPLQELFVGDTRATLLGLLAAVLVVLLIACANLTHLALARLTDRADELAVRSALGGSQLRIGLEQLAEASILTAAGVTSGVVLATVLLPTLVALTPADVPGLGEAAVDHRVLAFAAIVGAIVTLVLGVVPSMVALPRVRTGIGRGRPGTARGSRGRGFLVAGESAVVSALLLLAGLLLGSLRATRAVDPGFDTSEGLAVQVTVPPERYPTAPEIQAFFGQVREQISALPGVTRVGGAATLPLTGEAITIPAPVAEGDVLSGPAVATRPRTGWDGVTPGYFDAMGIPILEGRDFTSEDARDSLQVIAVNESFKAAVFGDERAVGRRVGFGTPPTVWMEVVAVVGDVRHDDLRSRPRIGFYQYAGDITFAWPTMELIIRARDDDLPGERAIREAIQGVDPLQPVTRVRLLSDVWRDSMATARYQVTVLGLFAALALVLGAVGIYGVVSHATGLRRGEMGVRLALGADGSGLTRRVLGRTLVHVGGGLALGIITGTGLATTMRSAFYAVAPMDPFAIGPVAAILLAVGTIAAWLPARRAARTDPVEALRESV